MKRVLTRARHAWLIFTDRMPVTDGRDIAVAFEQLQAVVDNATAAFQRYQANVAADNAAAADRETALNAQIADLQQQVASAEAGAVAKVQPLDDALNAAAPEPTA